MNRLSSFLTSKGKSVGFWLIAAALIICLILSILSWLELCVEHCSANQEYLLFGFPFAIIGIIFFTLLILIHFLSVHFILLSYVLGWLIAGAFGAEILFILIQWFHIGHWCPVCLSIAISIATAALVLISDSIKNFKVSIQHRTRGGMMQKINQTIISACILVLGFFIALIGVSKPNEAEAAVNEIKERIAFGLKNSSIEVYFVTDWFCSSCKKLEPKIEQLYPKIRSQVTFYFIDYPIHRKSLNFTPYNLAFLVNDKSGYFKARKVLNDLSNKIEAPNDVHIIQVSKKEGIKFKELSFLEIRAGIDFFDKIVEKFQIRATPTVVITNNKNNKYIKLEGRTAITEDKIVSAIEKIKLS